MAARDDLALVSRTSAGAPAADASREAAISADGARVAFESSADNLSDDDSDAVANIFVRDLGAGTSTLVSRATGATGPGADAGSQSAAISADGQRVAFRSDADNLSGDDLDTVRNIFGRDLPGATTTLVSRATGATGAGADDASTSPAISADGQRVVFASDADNLSADDDNGVANVFVRDVVAGTTTLVSRLTGATGLGADGSSSSPRISADGRKVVFVSQADNLSIDDAIAVTNIFVRDLVAETTTLVRRATGATGAGADGGSFLPAPSADGRIIAFSSLATNLSDADGDALQDVFARDVTAATTVFVSRAPGATGAGGDGNSFQPSVSADGVRIAFDSAAANLSGDDAAAVVDVFVRDLATSTTTLVSRASGVAGAGGGDASIRPALSADGVFVAFQSDADNLAPDDVDAVTNVFRRDVFGPPAPPPAAAPPARPEPTSPPLRAAACDGRPATIAGTAGRDVLVGTAGADVIAALGGSDVVRGLGGPDRICLGAGADRAQGGAGDDRILGGAGDDAIAGGAGRDLLDGGVGADVLRGGAGTDRLRGGAGPDRLFGDAGADRLVGGTGRDRARGGGDRDACAAELAVAC